MKQIYDAWPPDSEDVARELGTTLAQFGSAAAGGHTDLHQTGQSLTGAWPDQAGTELTDKVTSVAGDWAGIADAAGQQSARAQNYAQALTFVKTAISGTIAANAPLYEALSVSSTTAGLRQSLVNQLANAFKQLVGDRTPTTTQHSGGMFSWLKPVTNALGDAASWVKHEWDTKTIGIGLSGTAGAFIPSVGGSLMFVHSPKDGWGFMETGGGGAGLNTGPGVQGGVNFLVSDGQQLNDQSGPFRVVEGGGGDGLGGGGAYSWGSDAGTPVHDYSGWIGGATPGLGGSYGETYTWVQHLGG